MIIAPTRLGVHEVDAALLSRVHHELPAFVVENRRRHWHVEIPLHEPLDIGGSVVVRQIQALRPRILLPPDDACAISSVLRIPSPVACPGVHNACRTDGRTGSPPHSAARWSP